jgi:putative heme-binding domain-containing protein
MRLGASVATVLLAALLIGGVVFGQAPDSGRRAQQPPSAAQAATIKNPREGDANAIKTGTELYRLRCASCHSSEANGTARGSDLTGIWRAGGSDLQLFRIVRRGVPNAPWLAHSVGPDDDAWAILAYLRTLNSDTPVAGGSGNAVNGEKLFQANCIECHSVNGQGGYVGPDLSTVGSTRLRPMLAQKIRHASSYIMSAYEGGYVTEGFFPVTVVTGDGQRIRGVKKNEDAFSVQIMDAHQQVRGYLKNSVREIVNDTTSIMPDFGPDRLNDRDLSDLLAYLDTLRIPTASGALK